MFTVTTNKKGQMKTKFLTTAVALALATAMSPVFSQGSSGGSSSDGGGRQSIECVRHGGQRGFSEWHEFRRHPEKNDY